MHPAVPDPIPSPDSAQPDTFELDLASHPHDAYFKRVFSEPAHAAALLRSHLPPDVSGAIALEKLALVPGSFTGTTLKQTHSDLLFRAPLTGGDDSSPGVLVYLLLEHQTSVDRAMPLRLLGYMLAIWNQHESSHGLPLPPILPFVLHQGPHEWTVSPQFADIVSLPDSIRRRFDAYLPRFQHLLLDLSQADPTAEEADGTMRSVLLLMKLARENQVLEYFRWLINQALRMPDSLMRLSLLYALHSEEHLDAEALGRILLPDPELNQTAMSLAQKLRMEGMQQGVQQGTARGLWLGKVQLMEQMLGMESAAIPDDVSIPELESRFLKLQAEYDRRFRKV